MHLAAAASLLLLAAPQPAPAPGKADREGDKMVCKTWAMTGSLIANHKECRTRRDWDAMRADTSHPVQGGSCSSAETGSCY